MKHRNILFAIALVCIVFLIGVSIAEFSPTTKITPMPSYEISNLHCVQSTADDMGHSAFEGTITNNGDTTISTAYFLTFLYNKDDARVGDGAMYIKDIRPHESVAIHGSVLSMEDPDACVNGEGYVRMVYHDSWNTINSDTVPTHDNVHIWNIHTAIGSYGPEIRCYVKNLDSVEHDDFILQYYFYDENNTRIASNIRSEVHHIGAGEIAESNMNIHQDLYDKIQKGTVKVRIESFQYG